MLKNLQIARMGLLIMTTILATTVQAVEINPRWNQEKATKLAKELTLAVEEIFNHPGAGNAQPTALQQRKYDAASRDFEVLREDAKKLSSQLNTGKGYSYTRPLFKKILSLRENIKRHVDDAEIDKKLREKAKIIASLLDQLKQYY